MPRNKWSDKNLRVFIDPTQVDKDNYFKLQKALVASGNFTIMDRADAFKAVEGEQELLHRKQVDRFEDKEKWAHWGKMHGVGAIVVPHNECTRKQSGGFFHPGVRDICDQTLSMIDGNTGEIIVMIENQAISEQVDTYYTYKGKAPSWDDAVEKLVDAYPKKFSTEMYHPVLQTYQQISKEEAVRQKEEVAKDRKPAQE
jgi:hypothetical protein